MLGMTRREGSPGGETRAAKRQRLLSLHVSRMNKGKPDAKHPGGFKAKSCPHRRAVGRGAGEVKATSQPRALSRCGLAAVTSSDLSVGKRVGLQVQGTVGALEVGDITSDASPRTGNRTKGPCEPGSGMQNSMGLESQSPFAPRMHEPRGASPGSGRRGLLHSAWEDALTAFQAANPSPCLQSVGPASELASRAHTSLCNFHPRNKPTPVPAHVGPLNLFFSSINCLS